MGEIPLFVININFKKTVMKPYRYNKFIGQLIILWQAVALPFFFFKHFEKTVDSLFAKPPPVLISCITIEQHQNQEIGIGVIPRVHSDFISYTCKYMCMHVCMCVC